MSAWAPKDTSHDYGEAYQRAQLKKYRDRQFNHWRYRIDLAERLVKQHALPHLKKNTDDIVLVDIGCSVGTFAIEFARRGFRSYGVDFDPKAIEIAKGLSEREGVSATFLCGDVSEMSLALPPIDIAVCFDIFEHLHDDELGALLHKMRGRLSSSGCLIFHTTPTETGHLFDNPRLPPVTLVPFAFLPASGFNRVVKVYSALYDIALILTTGRTWKERHKRSSHCNPLSAERLRDILRRSHYEVAFLETSDLFGRATLLRRPFKNQPACHSSIYGVAVPKR
jgi:SAM-dependent methyltransferase